MSKFNTARAPAATSPVRGEATPSTVTHEGGAGYARDTKSELFLLAVTNMVGEHTFYESADTRDTRYAELVRQSTLDDPGWTARFLRWLRSGAHLRTASLVGAAEFAKARRDAGLDGLSRQVVAGVLQRADEPGELLAYWTAVHGRAVPKPVKRGVADAAAKLYDERSFAKWDSAARAFRFADVLELTHPEGGGELFRHILDERHNRGNAIPDSLTALRARAELSSWDVGRRRELFSRPDAADVLRAAGMTWESVAGWLQGPLDARVWEALIPSMGYMALLRNLRNFDEAGVSDAVAERVAERLADPAQVAKSRQLPMRFLAAHRAAPSLRWAWALERAIAHALANVPVLSGRTLILVDTSASMNDRFSKDGSLMRWDAAAVFGLALGRRCAKADVVSFSDGYWDRKQGTKVFKLRRGGSLLSDVERWKSDGFFIGGGTDTAGAVKKHFAKHDRVVILTDEQAAYGDVGQAVPGHVPLYTWNLAGYRAGHAPSGSGHRHTFGGLTDQAFRMIPLLERGKKADWPF
ncbi:TROVE domain-containing protein [Amycolatopsis sp. NPDC058278]|uniref:TROVE domain-containing protein n=1 Tax=Amycolatopsis sp. NPDC058278 TaxID=3346417 RepID=UPI0036D7B1C2